MNSRDQQETEQDPAMFQQNKGTASLCIWTNPAFDSTLPKIRISYAALKYQPSIKQNYQLDLVMCKSFPDAFPHIM